MKKNMTNKGKKYEAPVCETLSVSVESMLASSILTGDGGLNVDITPGNSEYDGEFNAKGGDWNIWN